LGGARDACDEEPAGGCGKQDGSQDGKRVRWKYAKMPTTKCMSMEIGEGHVHTSGEGRDSREAHLNIQNSPIALLRSASRARGWNAFMAEGGVVSENKHHHHHHRSS
jgi:hypothetical protein